MQQLKLPCVDVLVFDDSIIDLEMLLQDTIDEARQLRLEFEENAAIHKELVRCDKCVDGYLKKTCNRCKGTGTEETSEGVQQKCSKCKGSGSYVLRPTHNFEGKVCFACNGTGKVEKIQNSYYTTP